MQVAFRGRAIVFAKATNFVKANCFARVNTQPRKSRLPCASFIGTRLCFKGIESCAHQPRHIKQHATSSVRRYIRRYCPQARVIWNAKDKEPVTSTFLSVHTCYPPPTRTSYSSWISIAIIHLNSYPNNPKWCVENILPPSLHVRWTPRL